MDNFINDTIDTTGLPRFEEVRFSKLQPAHWEVLVIHKIIFFLILGIALGIAFYLADELAAFKTLTVLAFLVLVLLVFTLSRIGFRNKGYAFRNHDVLFRYGILATTTAIIPYNRIQHVALEEGPIARMFGLAKIEIFTATGGLAGDISIPGIKKEEAEGIKQLLMAKIQKQL